MSATATPPGGSRPAPAESVDHIAGLVDYLSSYISYYCTGGWVKLVEFDGEVLTVEMSHVCQQCAYLENTVHGWIENTARQYYPGLKRIETVFAPPPPGAG